MELSKFDKVHGGGPTPTKWSKTDKNCLKSTKIDQKLSEIDKNDPKLIKNLCSGVKGCCLSPLK